MNNVYKRRTLCIDCISCNMNKFEKFEQETHKSACRWGLPTNLYSSTDEEKDICYCKIKDEMPSKIRLPYKDD